MNKTKDKNMKLSKLLLPLTFLGLTPTARAATNTQTTNSVPQNKTIKTTNHKATNNAKIANFSDFQEDDDTAEIHRKLINSYNAKPNAHNIDNIIKLLNIMDDPKPVYDMLRLSIEHAQYFMKKITPELQKKLDITDKEDILFTAINNHIYETSDEDAFKFVATHSNLYKLKNPAVTLNKALNIALSDMSLVGKSDAHMNCISNIMNFTLSHQNDSEIINLYSKIFIATANMIRDYNQSDSVQDVYTQSINALTNKIEKFNTHITSGSSLDKEIQFKKPHEYIIQEYRNNAYHVNLALIYNQAYVRFIARTYKFQQPGFTNKTAQKIYSNYIEAIEIQYLIRTNSATDAQKQKLTKLVEIHPEINLFEPYFCSVYLNTHEYHKVLEFITKVQTSKSGKAVTVPKEIFTILSKCSANEITQQANINEQMIKIPYIQLTVPNKLTSAQIRRTVLMPYNIEHIIQQTLDKQLQDLDLQIRSMLKLTQNITYNNHTHQL